jgi:hypothetical protein
MSYGGGHLGFPIGIKSIKFVEDLPMIIPGPAGISLTFDPMGKMFQNASSLKPLGQLKPNCPGMIIGRSSTKLYFLCRKLKICRGPSNDHSCAVWLQLFK